MRHTDRQSVMMPRQRNRRTITSTTLNALIVPQTNPVLGFSASENVPPPVAHEHGATLHDDRLDAWVVANPAVGEIETTAVREVNLARGQGR